MFIKILEVRGKQVGLLKLIGEDSTPNITIFIEHSGGVLQTVLDYESSDEGEAARDEDFEAYTVEQIEEMISQIEKEMPFLSF